MPCVFHHPSPQAAVRYELTGRVACYKQDSYREAGNTGCGSGTPWARGAGLVLEVFPGGSLRDPREEDRTSYAYLLSRTWSLNFSRGGAVADHFACSMKWARTSFQTWTIRMVM